MPRTITADTYRVPRSARPADRVPGGFFARRMIALLNRVVIAATRMASGVRLAFLLPAQ